VFIVYCINYFLFNMSVSLCIVYCINSLFEVFVSLYFLLYISCLTCRFIVYSCFDVCLSGTTSEVVSSSSVAWHAHQTCPKNHEVPAHAEGSTNWHYIIYTYYVHLSYYVHLCTCIMYMYEDGRQYCMSSYCQPSSFSASARVFIINFIYVFLYLNFSLINQGIF